jgi:DNA-directed RNA polymerase sigma subunit (sigma70/sigma32)
MDREPMTLDQIARVEGVSHQMIAIILARAMKKMEKILQERGLTLEDFV